MKLVLVVLFGAKRASCLWSWLGIVISSGILAGCGPNQLATYPTEVTVTLPNNEPASNFRIIFRSLDHGVTARGTTDKMGKCKLTTFEGSDGAVLGKHSAAVGPSIPDEASGAAVRPPSIPLRYTRFRTSGLSYEVQEQDNNFEIQLVVD